MRGLPYDSLRRSGHLGPAPTASVYDGHVVVLMSLPSVRELVDYTRDEVVDVFKPYDPSTARGPRFDISAESRLKHSSTKTR
jgi:hypothetical protein